MADTYLTIANPTAGDRQKGTISVWVKRTAVSSNGYLYSTWNTGEGGYSSGLLQFATDNTLVLTNYQASGGAHTELKTTRTFMDTNAWYHVCINWDTTLASSGDRYKMFINGVRETVFNTETYPSSDENLFFDIGGTSNPIRIGSVQGSSAYYDGLMSHYHKIDGTAYDASTFGETDSSTGEWKIKTNPTVSYGSGSGNFFILKNNATYTDQSGEGNNLTLGGGTITNTEDNPSDIFSTFNSLANYYEQGTYAYGNTQITTGGSNLYTWNNSTLGMEAGKYYAEFKWVSGGSDILFGITDKYTTSATGELGNYDQQWAYRTNGTVRNNNGDLGGWSGDTWTTGDVISVALDMTNSKLYFGKNGTWQNSGDPTSGSTGTGAVSISLTPQDGCYYFASCAYDDNSCVLQANFGNGYFGTTQISSEGTNASNIGKFEYNVPTGYSALSTKGLNL